MCLPFEKVSLVGWYSQMFQMLKCKVVRIHFTIDTFSDRIFSYMFYSNVADFALYMETRKMTLKVTSGEGKRILSDTFFQRFFFSSFYLLYIVLTTSLNVFLVCALLVCIWPFFCSLKDFHLQSFVS